MDYLTALFIVTSVNLKLPSGLLESLCYVESKHNTRAVAYYDGGKTHSYGVCQIKAIACKQIGMNLTEKELMMLKNNVECAGRYLKYQLKRYHGNIPRAVTAYNKGKSTGDGQSVYYKKVLKEWKEGQVKDEI